MSQGAGGSVRSGGPRDLEPVDRIPPESEWNAVDAGRPALDEWRQQREPGDGTSEPPRAAVIGLVLALALAIAASLAVGRATSPGRAVGTAAPADIEAQQLASDVYGMELEVRRRTGAFTQNVTDLTSLTGTVFSSTTAVPSLRSSQVSLATTSDRRGLCLGVTSTSGTSYMAAVLVDGGRFDLRYHRDPSGGSPPEGCRPEVVGLWSRTCTEGWGLGRPTPGAELLCRERV